MPDREPGPAQEPGFFQNVMADEAGAAARNPAKRSWWQPPGQPRIWVRMAGAYVALALVFATASFFISSPAIAWMFAGLWLLTALRYLLSSVAVRRMEQRSPGSGATPWRRRRWPARRR